MIWVLLATFGANMDIVAIFAASDYFISMLGLILMSPDYDKRKKF